MSNELLFLLGSITGLGTLVLAFKLFGKSSIVAVMCGSAVLMNIIVNKSIMLFGLGATAGNVLYGLQFLATDILSEFYGGKEARKAVFITFFVSLFVMGTSYGVLRFSPAEWDTAHSALTTIFNPMVRIVIASMIAYLISNIQDTYTYDLFWKWFPNQLWIRNNGSTMTSQLTDTIIFCSIAFIGVFPANVFFQVMLSTYLIKFMIAIIDTPFLYLTRYIVNKKKILEV